MFFKKKPEQKAIPEQQRSAPSKFVLDLAKLKKEREAEREAKRHFFQVGQKKEEERKEPETPAYVPKVFDKQETEAPKEEPMKQVFGRTPGLLDRLLDEPQVVKNNFLRAGVFAAAIALLLFSFKIVEWTSQSGQTKQMILGEAVSAFDELLHGVDSVKLGDFSSGGDFFANADKKFSDIQNKLQGVNQLFITLAGIIPGQTAETISSGNHLINGGQALSEALVILSEAAPNWFSQNSNLLNIPEAIGGDLAKITPLFTKANDEFSRVDANVIPEEHRQQFEDARGALANLSDQLAQFKSGVAGISDLLGNNGERRYLVLFQNNRELRPTGGFIGSYSLIDVKNGKIANIETPKGGPYDITPNFTEFIKPPLPLQFINPRWEFHDANWFPDFPTSAEKIQWFYEKSGGPTVDGIIAITPNVLTRLLKIAGPLEIAEYATTVNDSNVIDILEKQTEDSQDKLDNIPKKIIAVMFPKLLEKILSADLKKGSEILGALNDSLAQKDILLYSNNQSLETAFEDLDWSGIIKSTDSDYLMVVGANLGGGKTDQVVDELLDLKTKIKEDGTIINSLTISRKHNGNPDDQFESMTNQEFIRIYVPEGSTLISASGFKGPSPVKMFQSEIALSEDEDLVNIEGSPVIDERSGTRTTQEFGKTVFGNWMIVKPGEFAQATFEYELPFKLQKPEKSILEKIFDRSADIFSYSLTIQKQPGKINRLTSALEMPANMSVSWNSSNSKLTDQNKVEFTKTIDRDAAYGAVLKSK